MIFSLEKFGHVKKLLYFCNPFRAFCADVTLLTNKNQQFTTMVNHYETAFVLTPVLSEPQTKEAVEKFENLLTSNGGTILNREEWGLKQLAYPIQGKNSGFYFIIQFDAEPAVIATLETEFRRDERVIRFLTTRLDKYAFEYAEKRRNKGKKVEEEA